MRKRKIFITLAFYISLLINNLSMFPVHAEENQDDNTDPIIVVSLGDSYSSGEGIEPFYGQDGNKTSNPDWLSHRSQKSWPSLLVVDDLNGTLADHKDSNWFFVAASGAVTDNLLNSQEKKYDRGGSKRTYELDPQLKIFNDFKKNTVDYVTMTFGGNDVGFIKVFSKYE